LSKGFEPAVAPAIRRAAIGDARAVARLIEPAFARHIAPTLGLAGQVAFRMYVTEKALRERLGNGASAWCASAEPDRASLLGYAELRGPAGRPAGADHLTLLFVAVEHQGRGVARRLLAAVADHLRLQQPPVHTLTVNASAYARPIYERLGFRSAGEAATLDAISATPMRLDLAGDS
jgi:ribosomal protein S18 acetylase RimI-like enzyme